MLRDYISFECLAATLCLSPQYLKRLIDSGKIPYLDTGNGRKRFQEESVRLALTKIEQEVLMPQSNSGPKR